MRTRLVIIIVCASFFSLVYFIAALPRGAREACVQKTEACVQKTCPGLALAPLALATEVDVLPPLVLVHIGEMSTYFPAFLAATIRQAVRWNPRMRVYAVVPRAYLSSEAGASLLALGRSAGFSENDEYWRGHVTIVELENVTVAGPLAKFHTTSHLNTAEMGGFVRFTTERLFVVGALMAQYGLEEVFHMEIDNVLYASVADLLPALRRLYSGLAATVLSPQTMTAGFLYIRSLSALDKLLDFILVATVERENDMYFLSSFAAQHPSLLGMLPVAPAGPGWLDNTDPQLARIVGDAGAAAALGGFFDNAAHGQWLGGAHSIHTQNVVLPHHENGIALFKTSHLAYKWAVDPVSRLRRPYIRHNTENDGSWRPLFTAHVHSKEIELFAS